MEGQQESKKEQITIIDKIMNTKAKTLAQDLGVRLIEGDLDAARIGVLMKKFAKLSEEIFKIEKVKEHILESTLQFQEGNEKTFYAHGAKVQVRSGSYWDFSEVDDPYFKELLNIQETVKELVDARKDYLTNKKAEWDSMNKVQGGVDFTLKSFVITYDKMPKLIFEEVEDSIETNPPVQRGKANLAYFV